MRLVLFLLLAAILLGCKSKQVLSTEDTVLTRQSMDAKDLSFSLTKGGCYGKCPVYDLRIYNNRYVEFIGKQHTDKLGTHIKMLDKESYKNLIKAFNDAKFISLQDNYESNIPDLPTITISYNTGNQQKTVTGKRERPESVHKLQFQLEQVAENASGWTYLADATTEKKEQKVDKSKIVVDIAQGNQLARWFSKMKDEYGMQIIQKLSNNSDSWLVGINPKLHNPDAVLENLNNDPVVKKAAFHVTLGEN